MAAASDAIILTSKILVKPESIASFADWQAKIHAVIARQPGFVSLEILSPVSPKQNEWLLVQRFISSDDATNWHRSEIRQSLMAELAPYLIGNSQESIKESFSGAGNVQNGITEVFVTQVHPKNESAYREWIAKIHQAEAKFPGFKGVYVQSPSQKGGTYWITLLHFDTPENLDQWLHSPERQKVLEEAAPLISSIESHRMISPYAGWFASVAKEGELPPVWKQTMLVLLVLFPIVMLEFKYLSPLTTGLNLSVATFIGNAVSVTLISWPMMPIAIRLLGWWLTPPPKKHKLLSFSGTFLILFIYLIEILIFWVVSNP